jgi:F-box/leucine-rich repeat protein 2/20
LTEASLAHLGELSRLTKLDLSSVDGVSEAGLVSVFTRLNQLLTLYLCDTLHVTDAVIQTVVGSCCGTLESVFLSGQSSLTDGSISALLSRCRRLRVLNISKCIPVTDASFSVNDLPPRLSKLNLSTCSNLTPATLLLFE